MRVVRLNLGLPKMLQACTVDDFGTDGTWYGNKVFGVKTRDTRTVKLGWRFQGYPKVLTPVCRRHSPLVCRHVVDPWTNIEQTVEDKYVLFRLSVDSATRTYFVV